ncbi:MAG TPA: flagellar hook-length control protein FliK [Symbiobacteriaceae bacterium]
MHPGEVTSAGLTLLRALGPAAAEELLLPGRVLQATVLTASADRAVLLLARGLKLEVALRTPLRPGDRIRVKVDPEAKPGRVIFLKLLDVEPAEPAAEGPALIPEVTWVPLDLPGGRQGWVQLAVQRDGPDREAETGEGRDLQVRLWWETPALGPVGVTLTGTGNRLTVRFLVRNPDSLRRVTEALPELEAALREDGFQRLRLACHPLPEGEGPVGGRGWTLDRRL